MHNKLRSELLLLLAAAIWGVSFVAQRAGMEYIGPFAFNGIRSFIGSLVLLPVIMVLNGQRRRNRVNLGDLEPEEDSQAEGAPAERKALLVGGVLCGVILFIASSLQQFGMVYTTAGKGGFITALYIVLVPIVGLFLGRRVRPILWLCVALATAGLYLLSVGEGWSIGKGDLLVLLCAFGFTAHILLIDHFSPRVDGVKLACIQFFVCGLLSTPLMLIFETLDWANIFGCWLPLLYAGVMSCGVAYTLQIVGQKQTEPAIASLILSLESTFALLAGIMLLQERITGTEALGCLIMFIAITLAQLPTGRHCR